MTFSGNLLYFPQFMTMSFADVGVWQFMVGHKWLFKKGGRTLKILYEARLRRLTLIRRDDTTANSSGGVERLRLRAREYINASNPKFI